MFGHYRPEKADTNHGLGILVFNALKNNIMR